MEPLDDNKKMNRQQPGGQRESFDEDKGLDENEDAGSEDEGEDEDESGDAGAADGDDNES